MIKNQTVELLPSRTTLRGRGNTYYIQVNVALLGGFQQITQTGDIVNLFGHHHHNVV